MRTITLLFLALSAFYFPVTSTFAADEEVVDLEPTSLFVPVGFDDNDETVAVVDGYLTDTCYKLRTPEVTVDLAHKKILVQPRAVRFPGTCMDIVVPYSQVVRLGSVPEGNFTVQSRSGKVSEKLDVKKATSSNPDDFLYAPIDSVQVRIQSGGKIAAALYGRFTNSCLKFEDVKVINSGKSLELLPIMTKTAKMPSGAPCVEKETPFEHSVELPKLPLGRYLLHVRSLNGQSVNEIFTNQW